MMLQTTNYLETVGKIVTLYQTQLLKLLRKFPNDHLMQFKAQFQKYHKQLRDTQIAKSIQNHKISQVCLEMNDFLTSLFRVGRTSHSERYDIRNTLKSQQGHRLRFTGMRKPIKQQRESGSLRLDQIVKTYQIQQNKEPKMRMKWKSFNEKGLLSKQQSTIGVNNIDLLSYTIPEMENSIRRLSVPHNNHQFDMYRTVDTRANHRKKFIERLF